jgi:hypothetical protein
MRGRLVVLALVAVGVVACWLSTQPPPYLSVAPAYDMGPPPAAVRAVQTGDDRLAAAVTRTALTLPGHDDIVLQEDHHRAFVSGIDGWIWKVDLAAGTASRFADPPLMPAGMRAVPGDPDHILLCTAHYGNDGDPADETPGVYELTVSTREVRPVAVRVPLPPAVAAPPPGNHGTVLIGAADRELASTEMTDGNSRPVAFCNDLDVSADGARVYFSEPFAYPGASMGPGAVAEAITLGRNGLLWRIDRTRGTVALAAEGYTFLDGVLLERAPSGEHEQSILITETPKFRILRLYLDGARAGRDEIVWQDLPGMPDGMDRDAAGRIWVGMVRARSGLVTWVHRNPWIKPLLLRLPLAAIPVPPETAVLALSPDAATPLYFTLHDGSRVREISVVVPGRDRLYLPSFAADNRGLVTVPYPPELAPAAASGAQP